MSDAELIAAAERAIAAAHVSLDLSVIERLYHPDFMLVQPDGRHESKAEVLASYGTGERHWDTAEVDQLAVRVDHGTGVVAGRWRASGTNRGQRFDYAARFLSVWTRDDAGWRNLAYQSIEIVPSSSQAAAT
jgi:ketosteroid isomerase-like protein